MPFEFGIELPSKLGKVGNTRSRCGKVRVGCQILPIKFFQEQLPELVRHAHHVDPSIRCQKRLYRRGGKMRATSLPPGQMALVQVPGCRVAKLMNRDIEETGIHVTSLSCLFCPAQR